MFIKIHGRCRFLVSTLLSPYLCNIGFEEKESFHRGPVAMNAFFDITVRFRLVRNKQAGQSRDDLFTA